MLITKVLSRKKCIEIRMLLNKVFKPVVTHLWYLWHLSTFTLVLLFFNPNFSHSESSELWSLYTFSNTMGILYVFCTRYVCRLYIYDLKCLEDTLNILHINIREELGWEDYFLVMWTLVHRHMNMYVHIFKDYINWKHISVLFVSFERKMHLKKLFEYPLNNTYRHISFKLLPM
jgi:hypothetical protein